MSSAKKDEYRFSSCSNVRKSVFVFFHRAKPVSSESRRFSELHCGVNCRAVRKKTIKIGK